VELMYSLGSIRFLMGFTMNPTKNLIERKLYMNPTKNLIEFKLYMNPTKNLIELLGSIRFLVGFM
jgi:hypothetical protein